MSDCANGGKGRWAEGAWHQPAHFERREPMDVCELRVYFHGQENPWKYPLVLNGRVIKDVFVGGRHYVAERECVAVIPDEMEGYVFCSICGAEIGEYDKPNFCHNCGARVVNK